MGYEWDGCEYREYEKWAAKNDKNAEILNKIEKRLEDWFKTSGLAEENVGFLVVQRWIKDLRNG